MREETVLAKATFDPTLRTYWMLSTLAALAFSILGLPLVPIWLILGRGFHRKQFERLECELTERTLNVRRGVLFRVEKAVPLDKIQDVAMKEGPILRQLGLSSLSIETAGSSGQGAADAQLTGVVDAPAFRDAILNQRDAVVAGTGIAGASGSAAGSGSVAGAPRAAADSAALEEISSTLKRIETLLERQRP